MPPNVDPSFDAGTAGKLSTRQSQVLALAARGLTDKQIAQELRLSVDTVQSHWKRLRTHFDTSSRTEIVARVMGSMTEDRVEELTEERRLLLFQLAEQDRLRAELEEVNQRLAAESAARADLMVRTLDEYERKHASVLLRLSELEAFYEKISQLGLVPHISDYGASYRKHWVGETIRVHGYEPEDWINGNINIFACSNAEDMAAALTTFNLLPKGSRRVMVPYRFLRANGQERFMLDLIEMEPMAETGIGRCTVWSLDLTDWMPSFEAILARGWPKLPLVTPTQEA